MTASGDFLQRKGLMQMKYSIRNNVWIRASIYAGKGILRAIGISLDVEKAWKQIDRVENTIVKNPFLIKSVEADDQ